MAPKARDQEDRSSVLHVQCIRPTLKKARPGLPVHGERSVDCIGLLFVYSRHNDRRQYVRRRIKRTRVSVGPTDRPMDVGPIYTYGRLVAVTRNKLPIIGALNKWMACNCACFVLQHFRPCPPSTPSPLTPYVRSVDQQSYIRIKRKCWSDWWKDMVVKVHFLKQANLDS